MIYYYKFTSSFYFGDIHGGSSAPRSAEKRLTKQISFVNINKKISHVFAKSKKGWKTDTRRDVTARSDCSWFCFFFFWRSLMISITSGPVNLFLPLLFLLLLSLIAAPASPSPSYCSTSSKRSPWLIVSGLLYIIRTVAQYVDIPLAYHLYCRIKACERPADLLAQQVQVVSLSSF